MAERQVGNLARHDFSFLVWSPRKLLSKLVELRGRCRAFR